MKGGRSFLYVAILTDTGSFHHANVTARTFEICRQVAETGVPAAAVAARVYQQETVSKLRLIGAVLQRMELAPGGRVAVLDVDDRLLRATGSDAEDLDGLVNLPLAARDVRAAVLFKDLDGQLRVSLRSKGAIDVRTVAAAHGGGGHRNAAGFTAAQPFDLVRSRVVADVAAAADAGPGR